MTVLLTALKLLIFTVCGLLGFVLVLAALVLLVPFRYRISAEYDGGLLAEASVSWLLRAVSFRLRFREKKAENELRLFGRKLSPRKKPEEEQENERESEEKEEKKKTELLPLLKSLAEDEHTSPALGKALRMICRMISHLLPKSTSGELLFGADDPADTGKLCAVMAALFPVHRNCVRLQPVFGEKILKGNISIKGRIIAAVPVILSLRILLDRNVRCLLRQLKSQKQTTEVQNG